MVQNEETVKQEDQTMPLKGATREKDMAVAHDAAKDVNEQVVPSEKADKYESAPAARSVMTAEKADKYENAPAAKSVMIPEDRLEKKKETNVLGAAMKAGRAPQAQGIMPRPVILLKVSNVDKALTDVEKLLIKYEAKNISRQVTHGKTILTLELKNQKVKDFKAQLKTIGRVEDGTIPATDAEGNITLVIEIGNN
jgi:hypothetical protein